MIFCVPTPFAIPAQRRSTSRMMLQRSAHAWLMMVIWAPKEQTTPGFTKMFHSHLNSENACSMKTGIQCCVNPNGTRRISYVCAPGRCDCSRSWLSHDWCYKDYKSNNNQKELLCCCVESSLTEVGLASN